MDLKSVVRKDARVRLPQGNFIALLQPLWHSRIDLGQQPAGGGFNASLSADFITLPAPLAAGASVNIVFELGVMKAGSFRFFVIVEAQSAPAVPALRNPQRKPRL